MSRYPFLLIAIVLLMLAMSLAGPVLDPEPIEAELKPVLVSSAKQWDHTKAYYQKVNMPDGSKLELKSRVPLTKEQWQQKADNIQKDINEQSEPEICPTCGGSGLL